MLNNVKKLDIVAKFCRYHIKYATSDSFVAKIISFHVYIYFFIMYLLYIFKKN